MILLSIIHTLNQIRVQLFILKMKKNLKYLIKKTYFHTDLFRILALTLPLKLECDWISLSNSKPDYNEFI